MSLPKRETWNTHAGMILAMIGTAIGLGNIWRFPYLCGKHGGGIFLIPYVVLLFGVAIFAMMCEWAIGRATHKDPLAAYEKIKFPAGREVGAWGIIGPFFLYSYYSVIASWVIYFVGASLLKLYVGADSLQFFLNFLSGPSIFICHAVVVFTTSIILAFGVQRGIELSCKIMIPLLFVLLLILAYRALTLPGAQEGVEFYMRPRISSLYNIRAWVDALGQVFFTLSVGMGAMIIYGSYLKDKWGIPKNALAVTLGNTSASILAGFVVFPAAFAVGLGDKVSGAESIGLTFLVLPKVFESMPAGHIFGAMFFGLLSFAAVSSAISIQEPAMAYLIEEKNWKRSKGAIVTGIILWALGLPFIINGFAAGGMDVKLSLLARMDKVIGSMAIPLFGFISIIAVGWFMKRRGLDEINRNARFPLGKWVWPWIKYVVPFFVSLLVACSILQVTGIFDRIFPEKASVAFVPQGIDASTGIMIALVTLLFWGGFIAITSITLRIERKKVPHGNTRR